MSNPNWTKLVAEGRAKEIGIPWDGDTDHVGTEAYARYVLLIPAEYVRTGCVTREAYEKAKEVDEKEGKRVDRQNLDQLRETAKELGIEFGAATPAVVLVREIERAKAAPAVESDKAEPAPVEKKTPRKKKSK